MEKWVTRELAEYAVGTRFEDYPKEVIDAAKILLLDNIGCMLGGSQSKLGQATLKPIEQMGGSEEATLVGGRCKVPTIQAAFVNGTNANALDYDEVLFGIGHPGSSIIPSALAVAEWKGLSGKTLLDAILAGYDVGNRIGIGIQPTPERLQHVWGVGTWQTFSSVVAAAKALDFDLETTMNAWGVAGATAPLPNTQKWGWDLSERPLHWVKEPTGWPAWTGTTAAVLAANGFVGNKYILDGHNGFWIMAGSDKCDYDVMTRGLGSEYEVLTNIAIKPYSACRWQHPTLDCVTMLKEENDLSPEDIKEVNIHSFAWVKTHELYGPADMVDAAFCIPYTVTQVLMGEPPGLGWYTDEKLASEEILNFSKKVKVTVDEEMDKAYFAEDRLSARVEITTNTGDSLEKYVKIPLGDPKNPLSKAEIEAKFRSQAAHCLDAETVDTVVDKIFDFENIEDISTFMPMLIAR
jgi:2-methylcitrate dehydratase PrpD